MDKYYLYFFPERGKENPAIKIGYSKHPIKRLKQLQTGHPTKIGCEGWLYVATTEHDAKMFEGVYHKLFDKQRIRKNGEWFQYTSSIEKELEELRKHKDFTRYFE